MRPPRRRIHDPRLLVAAIALLAAVLPSCTTPVRNVAGPVAVPESFSRTGTGAAPDRWWLAMNDPHLDALVEEALAGNLNLRVLWDRLDQASATARRAGADFFPDVTGTADASRSRWHSLDAPTVYQNAFGLRLAASYELDLWGRVRSNVRAAEFEVRATQDDLAAAAMTLAAEVAATWYRILDTRGQIALLDEQLRTNQDYESLVTLRFRRGMVSAVDVLQQRGLVEATRAEKVRAESALAVLGHQVAILLGRAPAATVTKPDGTLPPLPPLPRTGLPVEWVRRRPDVRSAYLRLREADQRVAAAVADRFPRISLSVGAETTAEEARNLFDNWLANLAANLSAPLFDGGRREAEVDRTRAVASERLHAYGQTILESLKEVEDALVQEQQQERYLASLDQQLDLAVKTTARTRQQYVNGGLDYLRVLTALQSEQRLQRSRLQAQRELILFRIGLYRALGGAWEMQRPARNAEAEAGM